MVNDRYKSPLSYTVITSLFTLVNVLNGNSLINNRPIQKGDQFIITCLVIKLKIKGTPQLMAPTV